MSRLQLLINLSSLTTINVNVKIIGIAEWNERHRYRTAYMCQARMLVMGQRGDPGAGDFEKPCMYFDLPDVHEVGGDVHSDNT